MTSKHYKWFCRISETNIIKEDNSIYKYNFEEIFEILANKYEKVLYIIHNKDIKNIHAHFIIQNSSQIRKSTLLKIMPYGSCEQQRGSNLECYEYLLHRNLLDKEDYEEEDIITNFNDTLNDWLQERKVEEENYSDFINDAYAGLNNIELSQKYPKCFFRHSNKLDIIRETIHFQKSLTFRDVEVYYIYGESRTGKTYGVVKECKENNLSYYRTTDYVRDTFGNYSDEEVIIFDEYHSDLKINDFLTYLEGYEKTQLPSRYRNKYALYTKVYIISNIPLDKQYEYTDSATKKAFYNRIKSVTHYTSNEIIKTTVLGEVISRVDNPILKKLD